MKRPVHYSRGRLRYTGRIDHAAFDAWCQSDGRSVVEHFISTTRFALFGKARTARRRVWRQLIEAARSETVAATVQREIDSYLPRLDTLVYAHDLPRLGVDLHRLVVVPRLFANAAVDRRIDASLETHPVFAALMANGGKLLRDWFILTVIDGIETAVVGARPSPNQPLMAGDGWILVAVNEHYEWRVPFKGPAWPGHYYLLELTRAPITRTVRKEAAEAIGRLEAALPSLSRIHRNEILRQAGLSLERLFARACRTAPPR